MNIGNSDRKERGSFMRVRLLWHNGGIFKEDWFSGDPPSHIQYPIMGDFLLATNVAPIADRCTFKRVIFQFVEFSPSMPGEQVDTLRHIAIYREVRGHEY